MKAKILIVLLCLVAVALAGCVSVKYNAKTSEVSYDRIGDQELTGVYVAADPNGAIHIEIEKQQSNVYQSALEFAEKMLQAGLAARAVSP